MSTRCEGETSPAGIHVIWQRVRAGTKPIASVKATSRLVAPTRREDGDGLLARGTHRIHLCRERAKPPPFAPAARASRLPAPSASKPDLDEPVPGYATEGGIAAAGRLDEELHVEAVTRLRE